MTAAPANSGSSPRKAGPEDVLTGIISRIIHHDTSSGFCILSVSTEIDGQEVKKTVLGKVGLVSAGSFLRAVGRWEKRKEKSPSNYATNANEMQFVARVIDVSIPTSKSGMVKYLGSEAFDGVGEVLAGRLVEAFGTDVLKVIESDPDQLRGVKGVTDKLLEKIVASFMKGKASHEAISYLVAKGLGVRTASRVYYRYKEQTLPIVKANPYQLAYDIDGIGFRRADDVAQKLGIEKTDVRRLRAGIDFVISDGLGSGHCGMPRAELVALAAEKLEAATDLVNQALNADLADSQNGALVEHEVEGAGVCVFSRTLAAAEAVVANRLVCLASGKPPWLMYGDMDVEAELKLASEEAGFILAESQVEAIRNALTSKVSVITGGPGVGKSTILKSVVNAIIRGKFNVLLAAPTGKAAKRMTEATGLPAMTMHRVLAMHGSRIDADLVVIDESSMADIELSREFIAAIPDHAAIILVGDVDQIPSVGPGQVLRDIIESSAVNVVRLNKIYRQADGSSIIENAYRINRGEMPRDAEGDGLKDFYIIRQPTADTIPNIVRELAANRIPKEFGFDAMSDIQVLCLMNRGTAGAEPMNQMLQAALNPNASKFIEGAGGVRLALGDKVMQVVNNYEDYVYNGDTGRVVDIDSRGHEAVIDFGDKQVIYPKSELSQLALSYAITVHKSQGSQYPAVIIPLTMQSVTMLQRNLLYTGVTRAAKLVVLVGQEPALVAAVNNQAPRRISRLRQLLAGKARSMAFFAQRSLDI